MKKLLILSVLFLSTLAVFAQEETFDITQAVNNSKMPSDEEIMETIKKYNFDKSQQEYLFKEMKRNLEELYSNKNFQPVLNQNEKIQEK